MGHRELLLTQLENRPGRKTTDAEIVSTQSATSGDLVSF